MVSYGILKNLDYFDTINNNVLIMKKCKVFHFHYIYFINIYYN